MHSPHPPRRRSSGVRDLPTDKIRIGRMNMKLINSLLSIAILSASVEAKRPAFAPKQYTHDVLSIRGGAGPLDPDMIGKSNHHLFSIVEEERLTRIVCPHHSKNVAKTVTGVMAIQVSELRSTAKRRSLGLLVWLCSHLVSFYLFVVSPIR